MGLLYPENSMNRQVLLFTFGIEVVLILRTCLKNRVRTCPAISGAEPCIGSKTPGPCIVNMTGLCSDLIKLLHNQYQIISFCTESLRLADGSMPMLPVIIEASSDNISPKMLFVTMVSNCNLRDDQTNHCKDLYTRFPHEC